MGRKKRTDEEKRRLLLAWKASGKGCNRFAAENGVAANSLREWRDAGLLQPAFIALRVAPAVSDTRPLVLQLSGTGHCVEVREDFDAGTLRRLVDALC